MFMRTQAITVSSSVASAGAATVTPPSGSRADGPPSGALDLLPDSAPPTSVDLGDSMAAIYALQLEGQRSDEKGASAQVTTDAQRRREALRQQLEALERQRQDSGGRGFFSCMGDLLKDLTVDTTTWNVDDFGKDMKRDLGACDNPTFWSELESGAKWVALAASAVATVFTCGAAGPLVVGAALLLSVGGFVVEQTQCFGSASTWVGVGMQLGSAALTCGSGAASCVPTIAAGVAGTATAASGAAHVEVTQHQAAALDDETNAEKAKQSAAALAQTQQWVIATLRQQTEANRAAIVTLQGAIETNQQASLIAVAPLAKG
jgi:hypothetical protein